MCLLLFNVRGKLIGVRMLNGEFITHTAFDTTILTLWSPYCILPKLKANSAHHIIIDASYIFNFSNTEEMLFTS